MSFSSLPIIDLHAEESTIIQSVFNACSTTGFFYLRHHSLLELQHRMFQLSKDFFRLPLEVKEQHIIGENNHGYVRRGQENLDSVNTKLIDEKEAFNIGKSMPPSKLPELFTQAENHQLIEEFYLACYQLCMQLLTYLARSFSIESRLFHRSTPMGTGIGQHASITALSCCPTTVDRSYSGGCSFRLRFSDTALPTRGQIRSRSVGSLDEHLASSSNPSMTCWW